MTTRLSTIGLVLGVFSAASLLAAQSVSGAGNVTFTKDVAPILQRSCQVCHRPGQMAPMSLLGYEGLARVARQSHRNAARLAAGLCGVSGVARAFEGPHFHEVGLRLERPVRPVLDALADKNILGGYDLSADYPDLGNVVLVCATETKTDDDIDAYVAEMREVLAASAVRSA